VVPHAGLQIAGERCRVGGECGMMRALSRRHPFSCGWLGVQVTSRDPLVYPWMTKKVANARTNWGYECEEHHGVRSTRMMEYRGCQSLVESHRWQDGL